VHGAPTPSEHEILDQLARGIRNRAIAELLLSNLRTVESHLSSIYGKLGVGARLQTIIWAIHEEQRLCSAAVGLRQARHHGDWCSHRGG